jgi:hypothetical protein
MLVQLSLLSRDALVANTKKIAVNKGLLIKLKIHVLFVLNFYQFAN